MLQSFFCVNCRRKFFSENPDAICPNCGSDNIRPVGKKSLFSKIAGCLILFSGCCVGSYLLFPEDILPVYPTEEKEVILPEEVLSVPDMPSKEKDSKPEILEISAPEYLPLSREYTFVARVGSHEADKVEYRLMDEFTDDVIAVSHTGEFRVRPTESGIYKVIARNIRTGAVSNEQYVQGCIKKEVIDRLEKTELLSLLKNGDYSSTPKDFDSKFSGNLKLNVIGMDKSEPEVTVLSEIFNRVGMGIWSSLEIIDVEYDHDNRISSLVVRVIY